MRDYLREIDDERGETPTFGRDHSPNSTEAAAAGQGRYVVPFTMSREEEAVGMEMARSQLPSLMAECAADASDDAWTRVKSSKKSAGPSSGRNTLIKPNEGPRRRNGDRPERIKQCPCRQETITSQWCTVFGAAQQ